MHSYLLKNNTHQNRGAPTADAKSWRLRSKMNKSCCLAAEVKINKRILYASFLKRSNCNFHRKSARKKHCCRIKSSV